MSKPNHKPAIKQHTMVTEPTDAQPSLWLMLLITLALTFITCSPILSSDKEFTNWDDVGYVIEQPLIKSLDGEGISRMFDPASTVLFNYHPLTMLSLAVDYQRGYDADTNTISIAPFAFTNLLLHLANTLLVFLLAYALSKKQVWVAAIAAVIFGIHPLHIESVVWISERKDLLYCFFFLLSLISYLKYTEEQKLSFLGLSFVFFIASCLSKAMAVPLPLVLFLTDYFIKRKLTTRTWLEKLPFLIVAIIVGLYAVNVQQGALMGREYNTIERILFAGHGYFQYLLKFFLPTGLSAFHPYPADNNVPAYYYVTLVVALAVIVLPIIMIIRKHKQAERLLWSIGFYSLMVAMVLQFITIGNSTMNDRYTYVAYIGLCFGLASYAGDVIAQKKYRTVAIGTTTCFILLLAATAYSRAAVWQNSETLWRDVISKYSIEKQGKMNLNVKTAYKNLADHYATKQEFDSAFSYYKLIAATGLQDAEVWSNMGNIYVLRNDMLNALSAFSTSIKMDATNYDTWFKRGLVYMYMKQPDKALADMNHVLQLQPDHKEAAAFKQQFSNSTKHK